MFQITPVWRTGGGDESVLPSRSTHPCRIIWFAPARITTHSSPPVASSREASSPVLTRSHGGVSVPWVHPLAPPRGDQTTRHGAATCVSTAVVVVQLSTQQFSTVLALVEEVVEVQQLSKVVVALVEEVVVVVQLSTQQLSKVLVVDVEVVVVEEVVVQLTTQQQQQQRRLSARIQGQLGVHSPDQVAAK
ncbi:unnamed protein product [Merluccius merluccius]